MEIALIVQILVTALGGVLWYLYTDLSKKNDSLYKDHMSFKTHVAEGYATQPQLTRAIEAVSKNVEGMTAGLSRIEERLYNINSNDRRNTPPT